MDKAQWKTLNIETSRLGFGAMRFPINEHGDIDEALAETLVDAAYNAGVTYFDTAYIYHDGKSEEFLARCLSKYPREHYTLATKLPMMTVKTLEDAKKIFEEQLRRLNATTIDFYMLHGLDDESFHLAVGLGLIAFCEQLKAEGKIKYFGFSFHDAYPVFEKILNYRAWDFCQLQLNYMDVEEQAGLKGYYLAEKLGVPVIVMEPVKGGSLSALPEDVVAEFTRLHPLATQASWAMHWLGGFSNAKVILSGMSTMAQLEDNVKTFTNFYPLGEEERQAIIKVRDKIRRRVRNGCTGCRYCMPCPAGVDIPENFALWNKYGMFENKQDIKFWWTRMIRDEEKAKNCVKCGQCEHRCPQKLNIQGDLFALQEDFDDIVGE